MKKVISSGSIAMDIVFECSGLPANDGFSRIFSERMVPGGSSANVMVAAANYGMITQQVGKVGDDEMGRRFVQSLAEDKVGSDFMYLKEGGVTMHTYIVTAPGGQHTILANFGTCMTDFSRDELPADILHDVDIVYSDMFSADVSDYLVTEGARLGKTVVYNMQCVPSLLETFGTSREIIERALDTCTLLIGGEAPYLELVPEELYGDTEAAVKYVVEKYGMADGAIVTLGSKGAVWYDGKTMHSSPAFRVEDVVDTTGCGDSFLGSLLYAYYEKGMSKVDAMSFANAAAAIKCSIPGPRIHTCEQEVNDFIKSF